MGFLDTLSPQQKIIGAGAAGLVGLLMLGGLGKKKKGGDAASQLGIVDVRRPTDDINAPAGIPRLPDFVINNQIPDQRPIGTPLTPGVPPPGATIPVTTPPGAALPPGAGKPPGRPKPGKKPGGVDPGHKRPTDKKREKKRAKREENLKRKEEKSRKVRNDSRAPQSHRDPTTPHRQREQGNAGFSNHDRPDNGRDRRDPPAARQPKQIDRPHIPELDGPKQGKNVTQRREIVQTGPNRNQHVNVVLNANTGQRQSNVLKPRKRK